MSGFAKDICSLPSAVFTSASVSRCWNDFWVVMGPVDLLVGLVQPLVGLLVRSLVQKSSVPSLPLPMAVSSPNRPHNSRFLTFL